MNRLFFAVLAALILSAPPAVPAEERTAAQMEEAPAAYDPAWDIPASELPPATTYFSASIP